MNSSSIGIIGGADGPTAIFITSSPNWINIFGIIIVILLLIPNVIYALTHKGEQAQRCGKSIVILEQIGRYACMLLMVCNIGLKEFGYSSVFGLLTYFFGNVILLIAYWVCWAVYFKKPGKGLAMTLAIIPSAIFLLSGLTLRHWLLVAAAVVFTFAHIYITNQNSKVL